MSPLPFERENIVFQGSTESLLNVTLCEMHGMKSIEVSLICHNVRKEKAILY